MTDFMQMQITRKGALYTADCDKCGTTMFVHEWATWDNNEERDALQAGTLRCPHCPGHADPDTYTEHGRKYYAGRYSAPGYLDRTDWHYSTNLRTLKRELRDMYGDT